MSRGRNGGNAQAPKDPSQVKEEISDQEAGTEIKDETVEKEVNENEQDHQTPSESESNEDSDEGTLSLEDMAGDQQFDDKILHPLTQTLVSQLKQFSEKLNTKTLPDPLGKVNKSNQISILNVFVTMLTVQDNVVFNQCMAEALDIVKQNDITYSGSRLFTGIHSYENVSKSKKDFYVNFLTMYTSILKDTKKLKVEQLESIMDGVIPPQYVERFAGWYNVTKKKQ